MNSCIFESVEFLNEFDEMKTLSEGAKFDLFASRFAQEGEDYTEIKKLVEKVAKDSKMDDKEIQKHSKGIVYNIKRCLQVACDIVSNASSGATTATSFKYLKDAPSSPFGPPNCVIIFFAIFRSFFLISIGNCNFF